MRQEHLLRKRMSENEIETKNQIEKQYKGFESQINMLGRNKAVNEQQLGQLIQNISENRDARQQQFQLVRDVMHNTPEFKSALTKWKEKKDDKEKDYSKIIMIVAIIAILILIFK